MKNSIFYFISCFLFLFPSHAHSQDVDSILMKYSEHYAPEHIHLQLDRSVYGTVDTVWFKAYIKSGFDNEALSKNLYVDWIGEDEKVLAHQIYPISASGISTGLFPISKEFTGKVLYLRAYTRWLLNSDSSFLYQRDIHIVHQQSLLNKNSTVANTQKKSNPNLITSKAANSLVNHTLTFLPEGGNAVAGIGCRIAFLCCDQWGRPENVKGEIKDSKGNNVSDIEARHDGMGSFWLLPLSGENYTADWKDEQGNTHQTSLPVIQPEGITLNISDVGNDKKFVIQRSDNAPDNLKQLHIVATMLMRPIYMATINLSNDNATTGLISQAGLPAGGMVVTLFDKNWQPVAERICFVNHIEQSTFKTNITWEKKSLNKRGYNQLLITIPDSLPSNLSISVTDAGLPKDSINNNNILSELLLTGDIRGRVYNPDYYFSDTTEKIKADLDLVMLTHGWRKYDWSKIIKGEYPPIKYSRDTGYYTLSGKVSGISKKKLSNSGSLFLVLQGKDSTKQSRLVDVNMDGSFALPTLLFDSTRIYYRFTGKKDPSGYMNFNLNKPDLMLTAFKTNLNRNTPLSAPISEMKDTAFVDRQNYFLRKRLQLDKHELATVTIIGRKKTEQQKMQDKYVNNPLFKSNGVMPSYFLDIEHSTTASVFAGSIIDYLNFNVPGFRNGQWFYRSAAPISFKYIIDEGAPSDDPPFIPMSNIAYIEAFPPPFVGAPLNDGAIVIYTRKGDDVDANTSSMPFVYSEGYTPLKEFYLPNYGGKDSVNQEEDIRQTIYWNPILLTNKNANKVRIAFYNNDVTDSFRVVLEGIDSEGKITYFERVVEK